MVQTNERDVSYSVLNFGGVFYEGPGTFSFLLFSFKTAFLVMKYLLLPKAVSNIQSVKKTKNCKLLVERVQHLKDYQFF